MVFPSAFRAKEYDNIYTFTGRVSPLPVRHERGEGEGEGLTPALSSIVPLEEWEQARFGFNEEFCLTPSSDSARDWRFPYTYEKRRPCDNLFDTAVVGGDGRSPKPGEPGNPDGRRFGGHQPGAPRRFDGGGASPLGSTEARSDQ